MSDISNLFGSFGVPSPARQAVTWQGLPPATQPKSEMRSYDPSWRERIAWAIAKAASDDKYKQQYVADKVGGTVDFIPGVGEALGIDDTARSIQSGDWLGAGVNATSLAMGLIPGAGDMAGKGAKKSIRAYHSAFEPFSEFDFSRLGQTTAPNVTGTGVEDWALNLAKAGAWASDSPVTARIGAKYTLPVEISGRGATYKSLDALERAIRKAGGPEAFRASMLKGGIGHITVNDEEFGVKSFVGLGPEFFRVLNE